MNLRGILAMLFITLCSSVFSQNIGIGTSSPTNKLHVVSTTDPLRIEGVQNYDVNTDSALLVFDPSVGVVKYLSLNEVVEMAQINNLDSIIVSNMVSDVDVLLSLDRFKEATIALVLDSLINDTANYGTSAYKTTEVYTGKTWINGKKIYRNVIPFTENSLNANSKVINHNLNVEKYIIVEYSLGTSGSSLSPSYTPSEVKSIFAGGGSIDYGINSVSYASFNGENIYPMIAPTTDWYLIIEYTKN